MSARPETPELDKQMAIVDDGRAAPVQEFIDWLGESGHAVMARCPEHVEGAGRYCGICKDVGFVGPVYDFERLMASYFDIDLQAIETERRALLAWVQAVQSSGSPA